MDIFVCLDLGNDTLKVSFAYKGEEENYGKLMLPNLINQVAFPAIAYYDDQGEEWKYAEEVESASALNRLSTVVKIKSLLSLVVQQKSDAVQRKNFEYYYKGNFFPTFSFPLRRRASSNFGYLVDQKLVFEAVGFTPKSVCLGFFKHIKNKIDNAILSLSKACFTEFSKLYNISIVYPPKYGFDYVKELSSLVEEAFGVPPIKALTSTQAIGLLAFHKSLLGRDEKALIFDMGAETISVTKAWLNELDGGTADKSLGILVDAQEGHSPPFEIGGNDIDEAIANYLEDGIKDRETVGSPSAGQPGHIYESSLCYEQYLLMKDIKKVKMLMVHEGRGPFKNGIPISIRRETLVQRHLTTGEFSKCVGMDSKSDGVASRVLEYILSELKLHVNRDVSKIIFSGGMIETQGLEDYLKKGISEVFPRISVISFDDGVNDGVSHRVQSYESSTYAASLGGAIVAMNNYSVDAVLSYSYGTWLFHNSTRKHLKIFANRGSLLLNEENRFSLEALFFINRKEISSIPGDEMFSTVITTYEIEEKKYSNEVTYEHDYLLIGDNGSEERRQAEKAIGLKVVSGGEGSEVWFYHNGSRVCLSSHEPRDAYFHEGFVVDQKGKATPFFENHKEKNDVTVIARPIYSDNARSVSLSEIEFRLQMNTINVSTNT